MAGLALTQRQLIFCNQFGIQVFFCLIVGDLLELPSWCVAEAGGTVSDRDDLAITIYQSVLDGYGDAINLNEFDRYLHFFEFPHLFETFEGRVMIETADEMRRLFDSLQDNMVASGISKLERKCCMAQFDGPETIKGVHDSNWRDASGKLKESYTGLCTMRLTNGQWRVAESQFAEEDACRPTLVLREMMQDHPSLKYKKTLA